MILPILTGEMMRKFLLYACRWQLSSFILAPCLILLGALGEWPATVIANLIGACVFYAVDKYIFKEEK